MRPETPFSHRKRKLAIARGTPASSASFRDKQQNLKLEPLGCSVYPPSPLFFLVSPRLKPSGEEPSAPGNSCAIRCFCTNVSLEVTTCDHLSEGMAKHAKHRHRRLEQQASAITHEKLRSSQKHLMNKYKGGPKRPFHATPRRQFLALLDISQRKNLEGVLKLLGMFHVQLMNQLSNPAACTKTTFNTLVQNIQIKIKKTTVCSKSVVILLQNHKTVSQLTRSPTFGQPRFASSASHILQVARHRGVLGPRHVFCSSRLSHRKKKEKMENHYLPQ